MSVLQVKAEDGQLDTVLAFLGAQLEGVCCPRKTGMQVAIAAEELFINIAHYAYGAAEGEVTLRLAPFFDESADRCGVAITFEDSGMPYNPLKKADPDISLCADQREIGGLGIYIVKKSMDEVEYEYQDGRNPMTIRKYWEVQKNTGTEEKFKKFCNEITNPASNRCDKGVIGL